MLRFRGNRAHPGYPAILHLVRTYAAHLDLGLAETDEGEADIHWDLSYAGNQSCLVLPGSPWERIETECAWTRDGFPVPKTSATFTTFAASTASAIPATPTTSSPSHSGAGETLDACGEAALFRTGEVVRADWDLLSFCAAILYRRFDSLPRYAGAAREARFRDLPDAALGLDREPWVDRWMFRLLGTLPRFRGAVADLPRKARIWLTHDMDNLAKWRLRSVAGQMLRTPWQLARGRFAPLYRAWAEIAARAATGIDPFDQIDRILDMESGRRSANFFLANGRDHLFHRYDLAKPRFLKVLEACRNAGMDVGLHGQVGCISDAAGIRAEKEKIDRLAGGPITLNRQHYLRWDPARTFAGLVAAGIRVDSTLGYNDTPGFRAGTAWPYPWFDCAAGRPVPLLEVPLILGEFQFYDPQSFDGAAVRDRIKTCLEAATRQGGVFTALFHNEYFYERQFPGHGRVYADLLAWADARGLPDFDPMGAHAHYIGPDGN